MNRHQFCLSVLFAFILGGSVGWGQKEPTIDELASRLPKIPPRTPAESLKTCELSGRFHLEIVAAEPEIRDPVAIDFDEWGRIYVVELPAYNGYGKKGPIEQGSIKQLTDQDGDGRYETATLFAKGLKYPTAVACWDGGIFVGDAPNLLYMKDTTGDGIADQIRTVLSGFGSDKAGEAHLNSIRWGFDNRFHFSTSLSGGNISIADSDAPAQSVRNRGIILDPRNLKQIVLTSGAGQHGMSMDNWGRKFICSNSVPAQTLMYDDRYLANNPQFKAPAVAQNIAPGGKFTKLFRISPSEPWRVLRTTLRRTGRFRGSDEGGKPFGFFTGATGITIYRGDAWPKSYHGNLIVGDVANNLIYRAKLEHDGLRLIARRADSVREFVASKDIHFRPVQFANAPDGTLYVLDMYRSLIEGAAFLPPEFLKYIDPVAGNDLGRIYRIAPDGYRYRPAKLGRLTTKELARLLEHPNGWHRDTASRLLYQRQDRSAVPTLIKMVQESAVPVARMSALYSLQGLGAVNERIVLAALADKSAPVRLHALRVAESMLKDSQAVVAKTCSLVDDSDIRVRYQAGFSLGKASGQERNLALARLAQNIQRDSWFRVAVLSGLGSQAPDVLAEWTKDKKFLQSEGGKKLLLEVSQQIAARGNEGEVVRTLQEVTSIRQTLPDLYKAAIEQMVANARGATKAMVASAADGDVGRVLQNIVQEAKKQAINVKLKANQREAAIKQLELAEFGTVAETLDKLLELQQPPEVRAAAIDVLAKARNVDANKMIINSWQSLSPALRQKAAESLFSRRTSLLQLFDAIEAGTIGKVDLDYARVTLLKQHPDPLVVKRAQAIFGEPKTTARKAVVQMYQDALKRKGDAAKGRAVFRKNCTACHRLEGKGNAIGADLNSIRNRGLASILLNVLDPNREVKPKFLTYSISTEDGRVIAGMIENENANSLVVRQIDGTQVTILRSDIDRMKSSGLSFMPVGLEKEISVEQMSDLLAYLDSLD